MRGAKRRKGDDAPISAVAARKALQEKRVEEQPKAEIILSSESNLKLDSEEEESEEILKKVSKKKLKKDAPISAVAARQVIQEKTTKVDISDATEEKPKTKEEEIETDIPKKVVKKVKKPDRYFNGEPTTPPVKLERAIKKRERKEKGFLDESCVSSELIDYVETSQGTVFLLKHQQRLVIQGTFEMGVLAGRVSLFSSILSSTQSQSDPTFHPVFAPSSYPICPIIALPGSLGREKIQLDDEDISLDGACAVVVVRNLVTGIEGIEKVLLTAGMSGKRLWKSSTEASSSDKAWDLITQPTYSLSLFQYPSSWVNALDSLDIPTKSSPIYLVQGAKHTGKSTFGKLLLNHLLQSHSRVAYLDTDLGQPEFTTAGIVSLNIIDRPVFGPAFTHLSTPYASYFIGYTTPASSPSTYLSSIESLFQKYTLYSDNDDNESLPLIINTQGWVKGLGADLLRSIKQITLPTEVFTFESNPNMYNRNGSEEPFIPGDLGQEPGWTLESAPSGPLDGKWNSADLRTLSFISYFYSSISSTSTLRWNFDLSLHSKLPYTASWKSNHIQRVTILDSDIDYSQVLYALNASIVALVVEEPGPALETSFPYSSAPVLPTSQFLGLGIIRSIDPSFHALYISTPLEAEAFTKPISLVKGSIELPLALMLDFNLSSGKDMPYLSTSLEIGGRRRVRRNLMRRAQQ